MVLGTSQLSNEVSALISAHGLTLLRQRDYPVTLPEQGEIHHLTILAVFAETDLPRTQKLAEMLTHVSRILVSAPSLHKIILLS